MKGSPLLRTLWVALITVMAGLALFRLTARETPQWQTHADKPQPTAEASLVSFDLTLSSLPQRVILKKGEAMIYDSTESIGLISGEMPSGNEAISLHIEWKNPADAPHYFARLRLDPPGKPSIEHVFASSAAIDDIWEMP